MSAAIVGWLFFGRLGLALLLWVLIGLAMRALWRDLPGSGPALAEPPPGLSASLGVVASESGLTPGAQYLIHDELTLGRSPDCTVRLQDPFVSVLHARIAWRQPEWQVEDMGSHNGTFVGPDRLDKPRVLTDGDHITIGASEFVFNRHG